MFGPTLRLCWHGAGEAAPANAQMVQHSLDQIPAWAPNKEQVQGILQVGHASHT